MRIPASWFWLTLLLVGLSGCTIHPETGRRQMIAISAKQEARMGLVAFQQIKGEEVISDNVMANERVTRVGRRLTAAVGRDVPHAHWEFVVFASKELNAFALPGGKVGVYTGILDLAETDDELAAVIGHEIAHVSSRHSAERYTQQMSLAAGALLGDAIMAHEDVHEDTREVARIGMAGLSQLGILLPYSRLHESEADALGLKYAAQAGYDPRAAITFWQRIERKGAGQSQPPEFLSTHPAGKNRIRKLQELAPHYLPLYRKAKRRIDHAPPETEIGAPLQP